MVYVPHLHFFFFPSPFLFLVTWAWGRRIREKKKKKAFSSPLILSSLPRTPLLFSFLSFPHKCSREKQRKGKKFQKKKKKKKEKTGAGWGGNIYTLLYDYRYVAGGGKVKGEGVKGQFDSGGERKRFHTYGVKTIFEGTFFFYYYYKHQSALKYCKPKKKLLKKKGGGGVGHFR
eukprot:TRINITY_DN5420_c0_g2_i4.p1 TRINITY_DN5420_c0_g2~~TRINITY_DN5420_c0_g2_i4.p1  ORF type:complete len:174 (-),score=18.54 TRINITY_DN5420_c0_g2_i4:148-669(-)